jgi:hypothetical protein
MVGGPVVEVTKDQRGGGEGEAQARDQEGEEPRQGAKPAQYVMPMTPPHATFHHNGYISTSCVSQPDLMPMPAISARCQPHCRALRRKSPLCGASTLQCSRLSPHCNNARPTSSRESGTLRSSPPHRSVRRHRWAVNEPLTFIAMSCLSTRLPYCRNRLSLDYVRRGSLVCAQALANC